MDQTQRVMEMLKTLSAKGSNPGGVDALVRMLSNLDRESEKRILQTLRTQNPMLYEEVSERYFTFEDLTTLSDSVLKKALTEVHRSTLALALKGTPDGLQQKVFRNLSERAVKLLKDDMDYMGPKPKTAVEEAQREVAKTLRRWKNVIL